MKSYEIPVIISLKGGGIENGGEEEINNGYNWSKKAILLSSGVLAGTVLGYLSTQHEDSRWYLESISGALGWLSNVSKHAADKILLGQDIFSKPEEEELFRIKEWLFDESSKFIKYGIEGADMLTSKISQLGKGINNEEEEEKSGFDWDRTLTRINSSIIILVVIYGIFQGVNSYHHIDNVKLGSKLSYNEDIPTLELIDNEKIIQKTSKLYNKGVEFIDNLLF